MKAVLVLNGEPPASARLQEVAKGASVFAADGGSRVCLDAGVQPELVVGDFDSMPEEDLPSGWKRKRMADQESTDFEKVLRCLPGDMDELCVLGAFGKRLDHMLSNLLIASALPEATGVRLEHGGQTIFRVTPKRPWRGEPEVGSLFSLLPITPVEGVATSGLQWNVEGECLAAGLKLSQSNRVVGPVSVDVEQGTLFVWTIQTARTI